jgi:hypothetical protein
MQLRNGFVAFFVSRADTLESELRSSAQHRSQDNGEACLVGVFSNCSFHNVFSKFLSVNEHTFAPGDDRNLS